MSKAVVIDDDPMFRRLAQMMLKKKGVEISEAENAADGIEMIRREKPDVVFLDVSMPGMGGLEALEQIRQEQAIADTKVFFMTGAEEKSVKQRALELGASGFITKPFTAEQLYQALELN